MSDDFKLELKNLFSVQPNDLNEDILKNILDIIGNFGKYADEELQLKVISLLRLNHSISYAARDTLINLRRHLTVNVKSELLSVCKDSNVYIRINVIKLIGQLGEFITPKLMFRLENFCNELDIRILCAVAEAIGNLGMHSTPELKSKLSSFLQQRNNSQVLCASIKAIAALRGYAAPDLENQLEILNKNEGTSVQYTLAKAIGALGSFSTYKLQLGLIDLLHISFDNPSKEEVYKSALNAFSQIKMYLYLEVEEKIKELCESKNIKSIIIALDIIRHLENYTPPTLQRQTINFLITSDYEVQSKAQNAIRYFREEITFEAQILLLDLLKYPDSKIPEITQKTINALKEHIIFESREGYYSKDMTLFASERKNENKYASLNY